jgi:hypothetical protein
LPTTERKLSRLVLPLLMMIIFALVFNHNVFLGSSSEIIFNKTFGGSGEDVARSVQQTSDGRYIAAGWTTSFGAGASDFWLVKTDSNGNMMWNRTYGGSSEDKAYSVQQTSDNGYIVAGTTTSYGAGLVDFWLVKTDANGIVQWSRTYGGAGYDYASCVRQVNDGGFIVAGYTDSFGVGNSDFWLVKTDSNGIMQWNKTYGGVGSDKAFAVAQTANGGYAVVGETDSFGAGNLDVWLIKTDSSGNIMWNRTYGGASLDTARSVQETIDGGYVIAGWTSSFGAGGSDFWLLKTDSSGYLQWNRTYGDTYDEEAYSVGMTSDQGYVIAGGMTSLYSLGGWDFWQVKTDVNGNMQWNQSNGGLYDDKAYSVQQTSDGGYILAGSTESFGAGLADFWLTKNVAPPPRPPDENHDVAVTGVVPSRMIIGEGNTLTVNVTVANLGRYLENTMVHLYANQTEIGNEWVILSTGETYIIEFPWDTSAWTKGHYAIRAECDAVLGESESARQNNICHDGTIIVTFIGDVEGDLKVDATDLLILSKAFASNPQKPNWNLYCDFNNDGIIDALDLQLLARNFGSQSG